MNFPPILQNRRFELKNNPKIAQMGENKPVGRIMEIVIPKNPIIASQSRLRITERAVPSTKVPPRNAGNPV